MGNKYKIIKKYRKGMQTDVMKVKTDEEFQ